MIAEFITGIYNYFKALTFIRNAGLGRYFLYSGLIGLGLMIFCGFAVYASYGSIAAWILNLLPIDIDASTGIGSWITIIFGSVFFITIFKYLMLIFTAPLMSSLSEKVEAYIDGDSRRSSTIGTVFQELWRGVRISARNIVREIGLTIVLLIIGLFPLFSIVAGPLLLLVQSYYAGFGIIDFWAERHLDYPTTLKFMPRHKGMLMGNGIVYVLLLAIPIAGAFIAPPLATIAGTMHAHERLGNS